MSISNKTSEEYQYIAENWLRMHIDEGGLPRTAKRISDSLRSWSGKPCSDGEPPRAGYFRKIRSALAHHQERLGYYRAAEAIAQVQRIGHGKTNSRKHRRCKHVTEPEHQRLLEDAKSRGDAIMYAALILAYHTGLRPAELPSVEVLGIELDGRTRLSIKGAKVSRTQGRGIDEREILVDDPEVIAATKTVQNLDDKDIAVLKRRVSRRSHALWPRRKTPPTLYSYRHGMGSALKASGISRREAGAIMGHASQNSLDPYGHKNRNSGLLRPVPEPTRNTINKVRPKPPTRAPSKAHRVKRTRRRGVTTTVDIL